MTQISPHLRDLVLAEFRNQSAAGTQFEGYPYGGGDAEVRVAWLEDLIRTVHDEVTHRSSPSVEAEAVQGVFDAVVAAHADVTVRVRTARASGGL
jgi:hypothetical protein